MHERVGSIPMLERTFNAYSRKYGYGIDFNQFLVKTWSASEMSEKYPELIYQ